MKIKEIIEKAILFIIIYILGAISMLFYIEPEWSHKERSHLIWSRETEWKEYNRTYKKCLYFWRMVDWTAEDINYKGVAGKKLFCINSGTEDMRDNK